MSRVTVAIAFHDDEAHLGAAVRSVLAQTFVDLEVLLLDDGSTDRSVTVARSFVHDPRVRVLVDGQRRHLAARLNQAVAAARSDLFARMDADDVSAPDRIARQIAALDPTRDAVGSWAAMVDANEEPFGVIEASVDAPSPRSILERGLVAHATMLARTDWLRAHRYDETIHRAEDRDLWCRVGPEGRIGVVPELLYVVRVEARRAAFVADYRRGQHDLRRVILRHGPATIGSGASAVLAAKSLVKEQIFRVGHAIGLGERLVRRRGRAITPVEAERVRAILGQTP